LALLAGPPPGTTSRKPSDPFAYRIGLMKPRRVPSAALSLATNPAHSGADALVPLPIIGWPFRYRPE